MAANESAGRQCMVQGRIVWVAGDLFKGQIKKRFGTQEPLLNERGEPIVEYGFGLAVPKSILQQTGPRQPGEIWAIMHQEAMSIYPNGLPPGFSMKFKDGDGIDHQGQPFSARTGYAGCIVLELKTRLPVKYYRFENGQNYLINEGIKCGDYVNVQVSVSAHGAIGQGKPGLYMNPMAVQLVGYGEEIVNAPSGDSIFGAQAPALPPGASATPVAPQGGFLVPPGAPQAPQMGFAPPMQPAAPQPPPQPHFGVVPQQFQPPMQGGQIAAQPPGMPQFQAPPAQAPQFGVPAAPNGFQAPPAAPAAFPGSPQQPQQLPGFPGFPVPGQQR